MLQLQIKHILIVSLLFLLLLLGIKVHTVVVHTVVALLEEDSETESAGVPYGVDVVSMHHKTFIFVVVLRLASVGN